MRCGVLAAGLPRADRFTRGTGDDSAPDALDSSLETRPLEYLRQNFTDRESPPEKTAAVHAISERHLYTVLARAGITLRPWLREQRLTAAAEALARPAHRRHTIAAVAHRWGFAGRAHFTREFRKQFGMTPTQWSNHPDGP